MNAEKEQKSGMKWTTRQMITHDNREVEIQTTLRELLIYSVFVILLIIKNVCLDAIHWESWYGPTSDPNPVKATEPNDQLILFQNKLIGKPRLRQLRVRDHSCHIQESVALTQDKCWAQFSLSTEDTEPFGLKKSPEWVYSPHPAGLINGLVTNYPKGGFIAKLGKTFQESSDIIENLKKNLWIDRATRAVFLELTVYNINVNLFCFIRIIAEFPANGGIYPSWSFESVKLIRYVSPLDYFVLGCECALILLVIFYTLEEIREFAYFKWRYFTFLWNCIDLTILFSSYFCVSLFIFRYLFVTKLLKTMLSHPDTDFSEVSEWQSLYDDASSICLFFAFIKIFKYVSFTKTLSQLNLTLQKCAKDLLAFMFMFLIVFEAYAIFGHLIFGAILYDYYTLGKTNVTLLRIILGDFDYESLIDTAPIFGPIYFISFVFLVFFILMNMFLAIINDTFSEVKDDVKKTKDVVQVSTFLRRCTYNSPCVKTDPTYIRLSGVLMNNGFESHEIEQFFEKYGIAVNRPITEESIQAMIDNYIQYSLPLRKQTEEEKEMLERVKKIEDLINSMDSKMDMIIRRLDAALATKKE